MGPRYLRISHEIKDRQTKENQAAIRRGKTQSRPRRARQIQGRIRENPGHLRRPQREIHQINRGEKRLGEITQCQQKENQHCRYSYHVFIRRKTTLGKRSHRNFGTKKEISRKRLSCDRFHFLLRSFQRRIQKHFSQRLLRQRHEKQKGPSHPGTRIDLLLSRRRHNRRVELTGTS